MGNQLKRFPILLYLVFILILCIAIFYTVFVSPTAILTSVIPYSCKKSLSFEQLCYTSENGTFPRSHLRQIVFDKFNDNNAYVNTSNASKQLLISQNYTTLNDFIVNCREAFLSRRLQIATTTIRTIFRSPPFKDMVKPSCDGLWMEFGVFKGNTLSIIANWKASYCDQNSQPVYGFDTFEGLPTDWRPGFDRGTFRIENLTRIQVPSNTVLVKGLFIDTLPIHLRSVDMQYKCHTPVSFIHIDCDIYDGTKDVLFLLGSRFGPGTIIVFDELFNYPNFEKHETKALHKFLAGSNLRLIPLGASSLLLLKEIFEIRYLEEI